MQRIHRVPMTLALLALLASSAMAAEADFSVNQRETPKFFTVFAAEPAGPNQASNSAPSATSQTPSSLPRVSTVQPAPMTGKEKFRYYLRSTYGPKSIGYTIAGAGIKQAQGSVPEWGGGMEGYGKRFASSFGQKAVNRSIRIGLDGLLHEDPRYFASGRSGIWSRVMYAVGQTFVVHKDAGGTRLAYSRFAGDFGAAYVSRQWHPDTYHTASDYLSSGFSSIGIDAAKNVWSEFWPDVKRLLHH